MHDAIRWLLDSLNAHFTHHYGFFGHSLGAILAFELCREIRRRGLPSPTALIVSGSRAPQIRDSSAPLHRLTDAELVKEVCARGGVIPEELLARPESLQEFLPAIRADMELLETWSYRDEEPLDVPLVAFCAKDDALANPEQIKMWQLQTRGSFQAHVLAGGHFFIFIDRVRAQFLKIVVETLLDLARKRQ